MDNSEAAREGFAPGRWQHEIDVRNFIVRNTRSHDGDEAFLAGISDRTKAVFDSLKPYFAEEAKKGVLDVDATVPSSITSHGPGYIDRANEVIVGLQTDKPFRRAIMPYGGFRMVRTVSKPPALRSILRSKKFSASTGRHTMTACSTRTRR